MIEGERVRHDAVAAHEAGRRHESGDAAERRGAAYRASGVGATSRTSPAASAAPEPLDEPPVKCARFHGLRAGGHGRSNDGPPCELVRYELAYEDGASLAQFARCRGVLVGNVVDRDLRAAARENAFGVVDVFQRERDAVQRPAQRPAAISVSAFRFRLRLIGRDGDERIQLRFERRCDAATHRSARRESLRVAISDEASAIRVREACGRRQPFRFLLATLHCRLPQ